jgi:hypothetical protein
VHSISVTKFEMKKPLGDLGMDGRIIFRRINRMSRYSWIRPSKVVTQRQTAVNMEKTFRVP